MAIEYVYLWRIPQRDWKRFEDEWEELTRESALPAGLVSASLYQLGFGLYISITAWPDAEAHDTWVRATAPHPYREHWRNNRLPESGIAHHLLKIN